MQNSNMRRRGFTLMEILVVIVIIGVMAALIAPNVIGHAKDARKAAAKSDIITLTNALKLYYLDNTRYPTSQQGLEALIKKPTVAPIPSNYKEGGYVEKLPNDPWGNPYQYQNPGKHGEVDVYSFGPNGQNSAGSDGEGVIGSWQ